MKKHIAEELPARRHPQAKMSEKPSGGGGDDKKPSGDTSGGGDKSTENKVSQAASDIRYRARRENITLQQAYSQYMQNTNMSEMEKRMVRDKLFGKGENQSEDYDVKNFASNTMAKVLSKVFVENTKEDVNILDDEYIARLKEEMEGGTADRRKYKVKVRDPKNNVEYVRRADRSKISRLRDKGLDVEHTGYGKEYEGERGKKAKKDYDGDGKVESSSKEHAGVVHNAIQRSRGGTPDGKDTRKEEYFNELTQPSSVGSREKNASKIDVLPAGARNKVKVNPEMGSNKKLMAHNELSGEVIYESAYSKFLNNVSTLREEAKSVNQRRLFGLALSVLRGDTPKSEVSEEVMKIVETMSETEIRKFAKTKESGLPVQKEEKECERCGKCSCECGDMRGEYARRNVLKNKLRSMGMKNPIMVSTDMMGGKKVDEQTIRQGTDATGKDVGGPGSKYEKEDGKGADLRGKAREKYWNRWQSKTGVKGA